MHNAHLCADLGYYYEGNDVQTGCQRLLAAINDHDTQADLYTARQRQMIERYLPANTDVVAKYEALLIRLMATPLV